MIKSALIEQDLVAFLEPKDYGIEPITAVHNANYIKYLRDAYSVWIEKGGDPNGVIPEVFSVALRAVFQEDLALNSSNFYYNAAKYTFDTAAPIAEHTFKTVYEGAQCSITAAEHLILTKESVLSLIRPPGHHSAESLAGGFCFVNNAAVAAQYIIDRAYKVAILDVDYHHGNGTQEIFYHKSNPLFCSIHGQNDYPYLWGSREEIGAGDGLNFNHNIPMPFGTGDKEYMEALNGVVDNVIGPFSPDFLVVSLGVDTFQGDPVGTFELSQSAFIDIGFAIGRLKIATIFIMEGGYAVKDIGENVANVLKGFNTAYFA